jgi:hypothetical protein
MFYLDGKPPTASSQVCPKEERLAKYFPISKNITISISNCLTTYKYCFVKIGKTYVIDCRDYRKVLQRLRLLRLIASWLI